MYWIIFRSMYIVWSLSVVKSRVRVVIDFSFNAHGTHQNGLENNPETRYETGL